LKLILLGSPGAGKGTQAKLISERFHIPHISTGDILRESVKQDSPVGREAKKFLEKGQLVPDEVVIKIVTQRLECTDAQNGFILDGFPRTLPQARELDNSLVSLGLAIDYVIYFDTSPAVCISRLAGRRVCPQCGTNYHIINLPPKVEGVCDECGGRLIQRGDDQEDTVKKRLEVYKNQTASLIEYYQNQNKLKAVSGDLEADKVYEVLIKEFQKEGFR
jgi:adenylate kinase